MNADSKRPFEVDVIGIPGTNVALGQSTRFSHRENEFWLETPPYVAHCSAKMTPSWNGLANEVPSGPPVTTPLNASASVPLCRYAS